MFEGVFVWINGSPSRSAEDVAPVSLITDGTDPSSTAALSYLALMGRASLFFLNLEFSHLCRAERRRSSRGIFRHALLFLLTWSGGKVNVTFFSGSSPIASRDCGCDVVASAST